MIGERIEQIRIYKNLSRKDLEKRTGIPEQTWRVIETGMLKPNEEHIEALSKNWPEYKYWLVFGEVIPEAGHISPELEDIRKKRGKARYGADAIGPKE